MWLLRGTDLRRDFQVEGETLGGESYDAVVVRTSVRGLNTNSDGQSGCKHAALSSWMAPKARGLTDYIQALVA